MCRIIELLPISNTLCLPLLPQLLLHNTACIHTRLFQRVSAEKVLENRLEESHATLSVSYIGAVFVYRLQ
jgi:hypothetical protein